MVKHLFHRKGKFVDIKTADCEVEFEDIEDKIECDQEKKLLSS